MIEMNLLPDVKIDYIKAQRSHRLVLTISVLATALALTLFIGLFSFSSLQKKHINDLTKDITSESSELKGKPQIDKVLTVQNQLESLTKLHDTKPAVSRLFEYLNVVTPAKVSINNYAIDFSEHTILVSGGADALSTVNQYVDTLKFTTYKTKEVSGTKAFSDIVLTNYSLADISGTAGAPAATYSISLVFDPLLFDITKKVELIVPKTITTRSTINQPVEDLFQSPTSQPVKKEGN